MEQILLKGFCIEYYTRSISHMRSEKDIIDSVIEYVAVG